MVINTSQQLKNLAGEPLKDSEGKIITLGQALASIIISSETGGKMKLYVLGTKFYQEKSVDLDASDLVLVREAVKGTKIFGVIVSGQLELLLQENQ